MYGQRGHIDFSTQVTRVMLSLGALILAERINLWEYFQAAVNANQNS